MIMLQQEPAAALQLVSCQLLTSMRHVQAGLRPTFDCIH